MGQGGGMGRAWNKTEIEKEARTGGLRRIFFSIFKGTAEMSSLFKIHHTFLPVNLQCKTLAPFRKKLEHPAVNR